MKIGDKVKLNNKGLYHIFNDNTESLEYYTNREAEIVRINGDSAYDYLIKFENGNMYTVFEDEIILAYEGSIPLKRVQSDQDKTGYFEQLGLDIGRLVDRKQLAYGNSVEKSYKLMQIFLEKWRNEDGTYTISDALLKHMLLMVRIIDKQNRIFNNPEFDLMDESPYMDLAGYSLLGQRMTK